MKGTRFLKQVKTNVFCWNFAYKLVIILLQWTKAAKYGIVAKNAIDMDTKRGASN